MIDSVKTGLKTANSNEHLLQYRIALI